MANSIVAVGSLNMDLVGCASRLPVPGETITGHTFFDAPGGKGANQAYAAAKLGGQVSMLGRVGSDDFGRRMRSNLEQAGCDVSGVIPISGVPSGIALIFVADNGQNSILLAPGANALFSAEHIAVSLEHFRRARVVLLQLEIPLSTVLAAARAARDSGSRVVLDPAPAQPLTDDVFQLTDILTPNESEAAILAGFAPGNLDVARAASIGQQLQDRGAPVVIVKLGDQGCVLVSDRKPLHLSAPRVKAIDTTAAGDVFNGALAVALAEGLNLEASCRFANRAAAVSVTRRGAQSASPTRAEIESFPFEPV